MDTTKSKFAKFTWWRKLQICSYFKAIIHDAQVNAKYYRVQSDRNARYSQTFICCIDDMLRSRNVFVPLKGKA